MATPGQAKDSEQASYVLRKRAHSARFGPQNAQSSSSTPIPNRTARSRASPRSVSSSKSLRAHQSPGSRRQTLSPKQQRERNTPKMQIEQNALPRKPALSLDEVQAKLDDRLSAFELAHFEWTSGWLTRARNMVNAKRFPIPRIEKEEDSPFYQLEKTSSRKTKNIKISRRQTHKGPTTQQVSAIPYKSRASEVPEWKSFLSLKHNVLAENETELKIFPEVEPDKQDRLIEDLEYYYGRSVDYRKRKLERRNQANCYGSCLEAFFEDVGINASDMLRMLLDKKLPAPSDDPDLTLKWGRREQFVDSGSDRDSMEEEALLAELPPTNLERLINACHCCIALQKTCDLDILAVTKSIYQKSLDKSSKDDSRPSTRGVFDDDRTCRICFMTECSIHGQYPEPENGTPEEEDEEDMPKKSIGAVRPQLSWDSIPYPQTFAWLLDLGLGLDERGRLSEGVTSDLFGNDQLCSDSCFWKISNRVQGSSHPWSPERLKKLEELLTLYALEQRAPCMIALLAGGKCNEVAFVGSQIIVRKASGSEAEEVPRKKTSKSEGPKNLTRFLKEWYKTPTMMNHDRPTFQPCSHHGKCEPAICPCAKAGINCEKFCMCPEDCERRFIGCQCPRTAEGTCASDKCICHLLNRECDPDLCTSCGAHKVLDPARRGEADVTRGRCKNVPNQLNIPKRTILGKSRIKGFGLFSGEPLKANDYISEYKGELLSKSEADRRGAAYHFMHNQYLFGLNSDMDSDATHAGNKTRFINHSSDPKTINCYPRLALCNGSVRIGLYASRAIATGEELFFDYGYKESDLENLWEDNGNLSVKVAAQGKGTKGKNKATGRHSTISGAPMATAKSSLSFTRSGGADVDEAMEEADIFAGLPTANDDHASDEDYTAGSSQLQSREASPRGRQTRSRLRTTGKA